MIYKNFFWGVKKGPGIGMEQPAEPIGKIAIILAPDDKGLRAVFGIPAVRRLTLLALQLGLREIHIIGQVKALQPILSDLVPPERFHPAEEPASLGRVVERLALPDQQRVLVLKANHVIDRGSLTRLTESGGALRPLFYGSERKERRGKTLLGHPSLPCFHPFAPVVSFIQSPIYRTRPSQYRAQMGFPMFSMEERNRLGSPRIN